MVENSIVYEAVCGLFKFVLIAVRCRSSFPFFQGETAKVNNRSNHQHTHLPLTKGKCPPALEWASPWAPMLTTHHHLQYIPFHNPSKVFT